MLGIEPIEVLVISPELAEELGHPIAEAVGGVTPSEAFVIEGRREIFIVDAGQRPLIRGLLLFHEVTHVVCPTDPPHGPDFVRAGSTSAGARACTASWLTGFSKVLCGPAASKSPRSRRFLRRPLLGRE